MEIAPITMGEGDMHCAPNCPYLLTDPDRMCFGTCKLDGRALGYYDWYLAHCKGQLEEENSQN